MTTEQSFFLTALSDHLNRKNTLAENGLNWPTLLQISDIHQMTDTVYYQCKRFIESNPDLQEVRQHLVTNQASHLYQMANRNRAFQNLEKKLTELNIPFFPFKGAEIAQYYPVPSLRLSGDIDFMMHTDDRDRAHELLINSDYTADVMENHEWSYKSKNAYFEIHDRLLFEENYNTAEGIAFCDRCWDYVIDNPGTSRKTLNLSFHFVYLLLHLRKHMLYEGVGFRQFYDLAVLAKRAEDQLDWEWIRSELTDIHLLQFAQTCMTFCNRWFQVSCPLAEAQFSEEFYETATQKIFANGVFGFGDGENKENANLNELRNSGKIKTIVGRIFPSYKALRVVPHYSFIKGKPWLLPVVWVYRLFRSLIYGKGADGVKLISSAVTADGKLAEREAVLQQWGL